MLRKLAKALEIITSDENSPGPEKSAVSVQSEEVSAPPATDTESPQKKSWVRSFSNAIWWFPIIPLVFFGWPRSKPKEAQSLPLSLTAQIGEKAFSLESADTVGRLETGLSWRKSLPRDSGMYFALQGTTAPYKLTMKNMLFPIDAILVNNSKIVDIIRLDICRAKCVDTEIFQKLDYIIELDAGSSKLAKAKKGMPVVIKPIFRMKKGN